ncbi:MAG TPA: MarR family transcriptional regulator [Casimicrobiaceae bacterium]|nr:MarR family transcriptional regulator [Casimicrobiaceae bacterium]
MLRRAHQIAVGIFVEECGAFGLTPPQHSALVILDECPGIDQATLARAIGFDRATVGQVVRGLERRRLVKRVGCPTDRRRKVLDLTRAGRALMRRASRAAARTSQRLLAPLPTGERRHFVALLLKLTNELNESSRYPVSPLSAHARAANER